MPVDFSGLVALAFLLGLKHGFDADHLAAIDAMTRFNAVTRPRLARRTGVLFSLGHGLVFVAVAGGVSALSRNWQAPVWLEAVGAWVSIGALALLGTLNAVTVARTPACQVVRPVGWRSASFGRWLTAGSPWLVLGVGSLFALSFDTVGQAALLAVSAAPFGGHAAALLLAGLFVLGMLLTDGLNSAWVTRMLRQSDHRAAVASRVMAAAVAAVSLATATLGLASRLLPGVGGWVGNHRLSVGLLLVATVFASFVVGLWLAGRRHGAVGRAVAAVPER